MEVMTTIAIVNDDLMMNMTMLLATTMRHRWRSRPSSPPRRRGWDAFARHHCKFRAIRTLTEGAMMMMMMPSNVQR
jgi:hypothetical protein